MTGALDMGGFGIKNIKPFVEDDSSHTQEPNTKMYKKISIMRSDSWINILRVQKNQNIKKYMNNVYERAAKEHIQLEL